MNSFVFQAEDVLPMHNHERGGTHITVVTKGSFRVVGIGWNLVMSAGDIVDWSPEQYHEFTALENDSKLINILK
jgi:quercetin dioxygenase-like cupin family protein